MIQIRPGDLIALSADDRYFYALILDRIRLFGGGWTYVFAFTSRELLNADEVLARRHNGWNAFVDFIWAKRENRIVRLARKIDTHPFFGPGFLKQSNGPPATRWWISDMSTGEQVEKAQLSEIEQHYPMNSRIDDVLMTKRVLSGWSPAKEYERRAVGAVAQPNSQ